MWLRPALLCLALALALGCGGRRHRNPDVILIVMDTTRADHLGVYGYSRPTTPRIDAFAREAAVYTHAWSTASWTLPAHASLLTGLYVTAHGAHIRPDLDQDSLGKNPAHLVQGVTTLAELLAKQGYRTAAFAGAGWLDPSFGLLQGYEVQDARNLRDIRAEELIRRALAWIDTVPEGTPIHLLLNLFDPHGPYNPPKGYDRFTSGPQPPPIPPDQRKDLSKLAEVYAKNLAWARARYDGEILYTDDQIGRFLDALRARGRYQNTLIVITADHGEAFGEKGAIGHGAWLYEADLHIPLLVRRPGGHRRAPRVESLVSIVDVAGIVAEETGIRLPAGVNTLPVGQRSLLLAEEMPSALFRKRKGLDRDLVAAIRWPWKVIVNLPGKAELYRLDTDPQEKTNLADGQRETALVRSLREELAALKPPASEGPAPPMRPELRERLRELGYLE